MPLVTKTFSDIITFTRTSGATYFDSNGVLQTAGNNVPRLDYNPITLAAQGLLIEEARTNSIRNNTMQGAVAGTPGTVPTYWAPTTSTANGITRTIVGTGTENGITYIDIQYAGTATANGNINISADQNNFIAALQNQVWTFSVYFRLVGGSFANLTTNALYINSYTSGGAFDANATSSVSNYVAPTGSALNTQRYFFTGTLSSANTAFVNGGLYMTFNSGAVINFTLRIGLPQLELGAFATSVIPTTTTALTRSADVASVNTLSPWFNSTTGTLYTESVLARQNATGGLEVASIRNAGSTSYIRTFYRASGATGQSVLDTSVIQCDLTATGVISANTTVKMALAYSANDFAASGNGGAVVTDTTGTVPSGLTDMQLGGVGILNGYLRRITYYPRKLSSAELQAITA